MRPREITLAAGCHFVAAKTRTSYSMRDGDVLGEPVPADPKGIQELLDQNLAGTDRLELLG